MPDASPSHPELIGGTIKHKAAVQRWVPRKAASRTPLIRYFINSGKLRITLSISLVQPSVEKNYYVTINLTIGQGGGRLWRA